MYLDPGTGSVIIQAVLAAVLGVGVFAKVFWRRIQGFLGRKGAAENPPADDPREQP